MAPTGEQRPQPLTRRPDGALQFGVQDEQSLVKDCRLLPARGQKVSEKADHRLVNWPWLVEFAHLVSILADNPNMEQSLPATALEEVLLHLRMMATEVDAVSGAAAEHMSLNRTELRALHCLRAMGDSATAGDLARMLALTTGATTRVIDGLVDRGHAQRMPDAQDRRRTVVTLSPSVKVQLKRLFMPLGEEMRRELKKMNIDEDALAAVSRVLDVARRLMREHTYQLHHSALSTTGSQRVSVGADDYSSERQ